jgi:hypothetical protein
LDAAIHIANNAAEFRLHDRPVGVDGGAS